MSFLVRHDMKGQVVFRIFTSAVAVLLRSLVMIYSTIYLTVGQIGQMLVAIHKFAFN